ncbi:MAG: class I SAM-dependent methyltransferase [Desulfobulbaceae bacterium]
MKRIPEPELMDDPEQVAAYAGHDLDNAYWLFVQCFHKYFPDLAPDGAILDLGCGPAAIPLRLARLFPSCEIHGLDGAPRMLEYGRQAVQREGLEHQVQLIHGILPEMVRMPRSRYGVIISNSFLHHLADPMILWNALLDYGLPNAAILIIDLLRPASKEHARTVVDKYMPEASPLLRQDMMSSLCAAFTLDEVASQLRQADLAGNLCLIKVTPIQFAVYGRLAGVLPNAE